MTFELIACAIMMLVAFPICWAIGLHYLAFFGVNLAFLGYDFADASLLAMVFALLAVVDTLLAYHSGRISLYVSAAASMALSFESIGNGDWLLSNAGYLSIATNTLIIGSLIKERAAWTRGKSGRC